jgi:hypothetical protein
MLHCHQRRHQEGASLAHEADHLVVQEGTVLDRGHARTAALIPSVPYAWAATFRPSIAAVSTTVRHSPLDPARGSPSRLKAVQVTVATGTAHEVGRSQDSRAGHEARFHCIPERDDLPSTNAEVPDGGEPREQGLACVVSADESH